MSGLVEIAVIAAVVVFVIAGQLKGQPLQGKRLLVLPGVLIVVGLAGLAHMHGVRAADIACITASALIATAIGFGQGVLTRLEMRGGVPYGRLPERALWLWAALIGSRVVVMVVAHALGADAAASMDAVLLVLGINRLAQGAVIAARATQMGPAAGPDGAGAGLDGAGAGPDGAGAGPDGAGAGLGGAAIGPDGAAWTDLFGQNTRNVPPTPFGSQPDRRYRSGPAWPAPRPRRRSASQRRASRRASRSRGLWVG
jgi:hypothetical protein